VLTLCAYAFGALLGLGVTRAGPRVQRDWPIYLRVQTAVTVLGVGTFAIWTLSAPHQVVAPILIGATGLLLLGAAIWTRGPRSAGEASLEAWAAAPNGAFWVLPMAGVLVGTSAITVAALANIVYTAPGAISIHLMRRDAPVPQRHRTSWVDQSATLSLVIGLVAHAFGPAPSWSHVVLNVSGPLFAFTGAAVFVGSAMHPHNTTVERGRHGTARWLWLSCVRAACLLPIALVSSQRAVMVVAALAALGAPAFAPVQLSVLYGYRSAMVNSAVRWGWLMLPLGLAVVWVT